MYPVRQCSDTKHSYLRAAMLRVGFLTQKKKWLLSEVWVFMTGGRLTLFSQTMTSLSQWYLVQKSIS